MPSPPPIDALIDDVLADLGFRTAAARQAARAALEEAGLTNPRKQRIALAKLDAVKAALAARLAPVCARPACRAAAAGRAIVDAAEAAHCAICGGSANRAAIDRAVAELGRRGRRQPEHLRRRQAAAPLKPRCGVARACGRVISAAVRRRPR